MAAATAHAGESRSLTMASNDEQTEIEQPKASDVQKPAEAPKASEAAKPVEAPQYVERPPEVDAAAAAPKG